MVCLSYWIKRVKQSLGRAVTYSGRLNLQESSQDRTVLSPISEELDFAALIFLRRSGTILNRGGVKLKSNFIMHLS